MSPHPSPRRLPPVLEPLREMALDLRQVGSPFASRIWQRLDPTTWERTRNPVAILLSASDERLAAAAADEELVARLAAWVERRRDASATSWFAAEHGDSALGTVAYFSMEFGLSEALPIYSGGLGILAGDHLKSAADLGVPLIGVGLLYQQGYFRQHLSADGAQQEAFPYNDPGSLPISRATLPDGSWARVRLPLPGRELFLRAWQVRVGARSLYLLDSNDPLNVSWDRGITAQLYAAGRDKRLLQEIVLGAGGWLLLRQLGIPVDVCHLNEGHAAFAVLARAATFARDQAVPFRVALEATRAGNVFTTHTPVDAAFDRFAPDLIARYAQPFCALAGLGVEELLAFGRADPADASEPFNMAYLALRGVGRVNGVSRLHGRVSRELFAPLFPRWPLAEVPVGSVTNGVHVPTWDSGPASSLWERNLAGEARWTDDLPAAAAAMSGVSDEELWDFRAEARAGLVEYVRRRLVRQLAANGAGEAPLAAAAHALDPSFLTLGFARRFTEYKRADLILRDPERLRALLCDATRPVQLLVAGKAHPDDPHGKRLVQEMARFAARPDLCTRMVFLEDYDMVLAMHLAAGVDVWINTPRRPAEACGTSGMKVLANGGLNCSVLDGWWDEAYAPDLGWAIGGTEEGGPEVDAAQARALYALLEQEIIPEFHERDADNLPRRFIARLRRSMSRLTPAFSSDRMLREYVEQLYLPASAAHRAREADGCGLARELLEFGARVRASWGTLHLGPTRFAGEPGRWRVEVQVLLGDLAPEDVLVELFAESAGGPERWPLERGESLHGTVNGYRFSATVDSARPAEHITARVVPHHPAAILPLELHPIRWGTGGGSR